MLIYSAVTTIVVISLLVGTWKMIPFRLWPDWRLLDRQFRFGLKSYTQILAMHLLFRIDVYMVPYFLDPAQTAFYSLALHFTEMILEIPQAVGWVIYPRLTSLPKDEVHRLTAQACRRTVLLTALGGIAVIVLGPIMVPLWYGEAFAAATKPLTFATLGMVTMSVFTIITRDFTSRNNQVVNIRAGTTALVMNVVLNIFMIPRLGISGAALATSLSYSVAAVLVMIPYRRESGIALSEVLVPRTDDVRFIWNALLHALRQVRRRPVRKVPEAAPVATVTSSGNGHAVGALSSAANGIAFSPCTSVTEWDALLARHPAGTVFHQMDWLRFIAQRRAAELVPYVVYEHGEPIGVFPVFLYRRGVFRIAASPPPQAAAPYLGPLVPLESTPAVVHAFNTEMHRARISYLEIRFPQTIDAALLAATGFETETRATFMLDLQPGPDAIWSGSLSSACRRAVRKATAAGVVIEQGDLGEHLRALL